jgi:UDP-N-acetylmuramoyl-tripeptide--D-alanyl-D-alanine ligase
VIIHVADTTIALQHLGQYVRRQSGARVVAITGSAGKTTTKDIIAEFLSGPFRVSKNKGNLNNHLGLPLSLLELRHGADLAVMELGMNHAGEISLLVSIAEPDVRVWTNVGDAHLGHFDSREAIADAKAEILEDADPDDVLICNADDPLIMARVDSFAGRRITFGLAADSDVRGESVTDLGLDGMRLSIRTPQGTITTQTPLLGRGNVSNLLAAVAVAAHFGVSPDEIAARARRLQPAAHRGVVLRLPKGVTVVDDSYNSSPTALRRALEVIALETRAARKAAVLGEMLELGEHTLELHRACGEAAAAAGLDRLIVIGGDAAQALAEAAVQAGMPADAVTWTASSGAGADVILPWLTSGDLVLIKGSRGIGTDAVVKHITEEFS